VHDFFHLRVLLSIYFMWTKIPPPKMFFQSKEEKYFIHNHLSFLVKYHKDDDSELSRIVGFEVTPNRFAFNFVW
jgi:transmembrane 9 superfamily member 2/4